MPISVWGILLTLTNLKPLGQRGVFPQARAQLSDPTQRAGRADGLWQGNTGSFRLRLALKEAPSHLFSSRESGGGSRSDRQDHPGKPSACRRARSWKKLDLWKAIPLQASAGEAAAGTSGRGPPGACSPLSPAPRCSPLPAPAGHTRGAFSRPFSKLPGASR